MTAKVLLGILCLLIVRAIGVVYSKAQDGTSMHAFSENIVEYAKDHDGNLPGNWEELLDWNQKHSWGKWVSYHNKINLSWGRNAIDASKHGVAVIVSDISNVKKQKQWNEMILQLCIQKNL